MKLHTDSKTKQKTLIFEEIECWNCKGTGEAIVYPSCPLTYKTVKKYPDKKCPHCGAKNKHSHRSISEEKIICPNCDGKKKEMEDKYSNLPAEIFNSFNIEIATSGADRGFSEDYLGFGLVGGATDYGRMLKHLKEEGKERVIEIIRKDYGSGRQAINFVKKGTENILCDKLKVIIKDMGYSVYPVFSK